MKIKYFKFKPWYVKHFLKIYDWSPSSVFSGLLLQMSRSIDSDSTISSPLPPSCRLPPASRRRRSPYPSLQASNQAMLNGFRPTSKPCSNIPFRQNSSKSRSFINTRIRRGIARSWPYNFAKYLIFSQKNQEELALSDSRSKTTHKKNFKWFYSEPGKISRKEADLHSKIRKIDVKNAK